MTNGPQRGRLLVFEPAPQGHGREWLLHLAAYVRSGAVRRPLTFLVAPTVAAGLREDLSATPNPDLEILALTEREVALCTHRKLSVSGFSRWWTMRRYLRASGAEEGLFLEFDHLSLPLALGLPLGAGRSVSGILFRPSVHYEPGIWRHSEWRRDLRKDVLYRLMLRHPGLRWVHSLDEGFPSFARSRYGTGHKVVPLVDPAFRQSEVTAADRRLADEVPAERRLFVLFGVLAERKGVPVLLDALARLDPLAASRSAVVLAGVLDEAIRPEVEASLEALAVAQPSLWILLEDRRLGAGEIAALVDRSEAVLAPYQRFVGSSGVLMWAASRGRPVIAQDYGLLGRLVRDHQLGLAVDTTDPDALAVAIAYAAEVGREALAPAAALERFAAGRTPEAFAAGLLGRSREEVAPTARAPHAVRPVSQVR